MVRWKELLAVSAKRFVWTSTRDTFQDDLGAFAVAMALPGAPRAFPRLLALECLVTELLAIKTLLRAWPSFEQPRIAGLSRDVEETFPQKSPYVTTFRKVHHHGPIRLYHVFLA